MIIDAEAGLALLHSLKDLGLRLAIDDYGTGYSSLNRLSNLPVDIVKIDKAFIDRLTLDSEGVELQGQRVTLDALGCDCIQGYLFAEPTPAVEATRALLTLRSKSATDGRCPTRAAETVGRRTRPGTSTGSFGGFRLFPDRSLASSRESKGLRSTSAGLVPVCTGGHPEVRARSRCHASGAV